MAVKEFKYKGKTLEELKQMDISDFAKIVRAKYRRALTRPQTESQKKLLEKISSGKKKLRTHNRDTVIIPQMIGKTIEVYSGQKFVPINITEEMLGFYLGEFVQTRRVATHKGTGVGATKSSKHQGTK
jgi:small subunit ribosomal protein S19|tara:strand:- start:3161 stop:3544 length:384 start_codon:yes stop_codon:yes gene_type:complete